MLCYEEIYGDDIDGNRGIKQFVVEVEDSDADDIVEALYDGFLEDETTGTKTILLYCARAGEDVEVEVDIDDYIESLIEKADADEDVKSDEDLKVWLRNLKMQQAFVRIGKVGVTAQDAINGLKRASEIMNGKHKTKEVQNNG